MSAQKGMDDIVIFGIVCVICVTVLVVANWLVQCYILSL